MTFKELLKKKDISAARLSRILGYNRFMVSGWCRGISKPRIEILPKLAETLGISIDEVVNFFKD